MKAKPKVKIAEGNGNHKNSENNQASGQKEKCQNCGIPGHQAQTCRRNNHNTTPREPYRQDRLTNPIRCTFCSRDYHTKNNCWEKYPELAPWRRGYAQQNINSPASTRPTNQQVSYRRKEPNNFSDRSPQPNSYKPSVRQYDRRGPRYDNRQMRNHRNDNRINGLMDQEVHTDRNPEDPQDVRMEDGQDERNSPQRNPRDIRRRNIQHIGPIRRNPPTRRSQSADFWEDRRERGDPM